MANQGEVPLKKNLNHVKQKFLKNSWNQKYVPSPNIGVSGPNDEYKGRVPHSLMFEQEFSMKVHWFVVCRLAMKWL